MANGMWDLKGWRILTPEEAARQAEEDAKYFAEMEAEQLKRWPMSQRRDRCMNCGAFMRTPSYEHTRCKNCGESYLTLQ